jgi:hypothetical protein
MGRQPYIGPLAEESRRGRKEVHLRFPGAVFGVGVGYELSEKEILRKQGNSTISFLRAHQYKKT